MEPFPQLEIIRGSLSVENEARVKKLREDLSKLRGSHTVKIKSPQLEVKITSPQRTFTVFKFSAEAKSTSNPPWFTNGLSEEYRAHLFDQRNAMREAGEADHVIRCKLLWFWFLAAIWTPTVSKLQSLIPPIRISS